MRAALLAAPLMAPARAAETPPGDEALMADFDMRESYRRMRELRPRIDELVLVVRAYRDAHAGKAEPDPGGAARAAATGELFTLRHELYRRRDEFYKLGVKKRAAGIFQIAMDFKGGHSDAANKTFMAGYRHGQLVGESKDFETGLDLLLEQEKAAYDAAVRRWQEAEASRRRLRWGGGLLAALAGGGALALFLRRRRAERLRSLLPAGPGRPWAYGARWDGGLRRVDPRLLGAPAEALLAALRRAAPPGRPGSPREVFVESGALHLVYPPGAGKPLSAWLDEGGRATAEHAVLFLRRLAPLLDAAHREGRAHGGLGPDCVAMGPDGSVTLEDFGVAAALAALGVRAGSPAYAAPELESAPPGPAADLYSLGVLLYELLTGRHPFEGTNLPVMKREKRYTPLSRVLAGCPKGLDELIDGLLEPDPARRRPAPGGLEAALKALG